MSKSVLFLCRLFHPHIGGVETHVYQISRELIKNGWQVTVLTEQYDEELQLKSKLDGMCILRIPQDCLHSKLRLWKWVWGHSTVFSQHKIVHAHDVFWWILPFLPFLRQKVFITFHGWEGVFPPKKSAVRQRQLYAWLANGVIQVGDFINTWYGTVADFTIYGAATVQLKKPKVDELSHLTFLGRLSADNAVDKVIQIVRTLQEEVEDTHITFIGDGAMRVECETVGKVTGFLENVSPYIDRADLIFSSSYLSIFNAVASGKMVCALYDNELKKEYLEKLPFAEFLIIGDEPQKLAYQLLELYESPQEVNSRVESAQEWVKKQSWGKIARQYERLWARQNYEYFCSDSSFK